MRYVAAAGIGALFGITVLAVAAWAVIEIADGRLAQF